MPTVALKTWFSAALVAVCLSACGRSFVAGIPEPVFVAIGDHGTAFVSDDGVIWEAAKPPVIENLNGLSSGAGRFVIVGNKGIILSSYNGRDWVQHATGTTTDLNGVTWTGDKFVAVGGDFDHGAVTLTSPDGQAWSSFESPSSQMFRAVVSRGHDVYVASNLRSDLLTPAQYVSLNGGPWTVAANGPVFVHGLTDDKGTTWVVGSGKGARTNDGTNWTSLNMDGAQAIATSGAGYMVVGETATLFISKDGATWNKTRIQSGAYVITSITFGRETYVAVAETGFSIATRDGDINNMRLANISQESLNDVAFGPVK